MNLAGLSQLLPLGGATLLLMYLIGVIIQERRQSTIERTLEREQWQEDRGRLIQEHEASIERRDIDRERTIQYLRDTVESLQEDAKVMRARIAVVETQNRECEAKVATLMQQVRGLGGTI